MNHRKREQARLARRMKARRKRIYQAWIIRRISRITQSSMVAYHGVSHGQRIKTSDGDSTSKKLALAENVVNTATAMSNILERFKEPENLDQLALEIARRGV